MTSPMRRREEFITTNLRITMKVRLYGDSTAVVTGRTKLKGVYNGKTIDKVVQFTDTLVKQNGYWRLAAGHVSAAAQ